MLRDLRAAKDTQAEAALDVIASAAPDVLLLLDIDWDHGGAGLAGLADRLAEHGLDYSYRLSLSPVSGVPSGFDLDGDGDAHGPRDALGYGWFTGDSGLALLSRYPLGPPEDLSGTLWADRSGAAEVLPEAARAVVPLATTAQWIVPLAVGDTTITLVTLAAGTPVFDGPEDRNGLRNRDELALVAELAAHAELPLVLGRGNIDPETGEGYRDAMRALLDLPGLQDAAPEGAGGLATAAWDRPGPMRVDYVLPPRALRVTGAGVVWPEAGDPLLTTVEAAGTGRLVWVDVAVP